MKKIILIIFVFSFGNVFGQVRPRKMHIGEIRTAWRRTFVPQDSTNYNTWFSFYNKLDDPIGGGFDSTKCWSVLKMDTLKGCSSLNLKSNSKDRKSVV